MPRVHSQTVPNHEPGVRDIRHGLAEYVFRSVLVACCGAGVIGGIRIYGDIREIKATGALTSAKADRLEEKLGALSDTVTTNKAAILHGQEAIKELQKQTLGEVRR